MILVLFKAFSFIIALSMGYIFKVIGFFKKEDYIIIQKIVLTITLPAAIINSFQNFQKDNVLFILVLMGLCYNWCLLLAAFLITHKKEKDIKILYMLNFSGFNIGSFTMPFVQGFMGNEGVIATCMFDTGNAIMSCGGNYAVVSTVTGEGKFQLKQIFKKLFSSVPFDTYLIALILALFNFKLPQALGNLLSTTANANGFLAMFMLGLMLDINIEKKYMNEALKLLLLKYIVAIFAACIIYFILPFEQFIKNVLTMAVFSPTSALAPIHTQMSGGNLSLSGFTGSLSIIISVAAMTIIALLLPI